MDKENIISLFKSKGLKATPQRIAVYGFLVDNPVHPDVETVYNRVTADNPSFSKTTVYNCLKALADCGLVTPVTIDSDKIHYDADTSFHGHFICRQCGGIYDFHCDDDTAHCPEGFEVQQKNVYYSGICCRCKNK